MDDLSVKEVNRLCKQYLRDIYERKRSYETITYSDLAEFLGCDRRTVKAALDPESNVKVSASLIFCLAEYMTIPPEELFKQMAAYTRNELNSEKI